ncbi:hypothetical protein SO802_025351 [Lithocarpus litseifolius]|uniref:Uncharacterized protein n=1 Tax=Lithocarpus litseifolius TaxID=425828 RepID=A0AAW2BWV6_9ROSI
MRLNSNRGHSSRFGYEVSSPAKGSKGSPAQRRHNSKSPYRPRRDDSNALSLTRLPSLDVRRNVSPFSKAEPAGHISPYRARVEEHNLDKNEFVGSRRKQKNRTPSREENGAHPQLLEAIRVTEKVNYRRRLVTAPRLRERRTKKLTGHRLQRDERNSPPLSNMIQKHKEVATHIKAPSIGDDSIIESTDSNLPGDIFFSRQHIALAKQKDVLPKTNGFEIHDSQSPKLVSQRDAAAHQLLKANDNFDHNARGISSNAGLSQTINSSSGMSGKSSDKFSTNSSKMSDISRSMTKFTANRRKSQTDAWFGCMRKGPCRTSKSAEHRPIDETSIIERTFVVESLRQFGADKHQPGSLNEFTCHKQEAQILSTWALWFWEETLTMALLHEIYGDACWNLSHDLRYFQIQRLPPKSSATAHFTYQQERKRMQVVVPLTSSPHHVELNVNLEANAKYALLGLVKEITSEFAVIPEVSNVNFKAKYKVMVLYEVDKATENYQHLIKWIMDCYGDACKLILCCEDDAEILESVKDHCKVIKVDAPVTHEIMEVLIQIARKEDFDLPMSFAAKIATKLKQNLRKAIMALEACKAHNYPFVDDQPVLLGWEEVLVELAAEILADPSPSSSLTYPARHSLSLALENRDYTLGVA